MVGYIISILTAMFICHCVIHRFTEMSEVIMKTTRELQQEIEACGLNEKSADDMQMIREYHDGEFEGGFL